MFLGGGSAQVVVRSTNCANAHMFSRHESGEVSRVLRLRVGWRGPSF